MSGLTTLPSELLHAILGYISDPTYGLISDRYRAFAGLARSCRALNSISTRYLYARYESLLEQPIAGFLNRLSNDKKFYHRLKHINVLSHAGPVQRARLRKQLVADIALLPDPYRCLWITEGNNNLAARNELELAIVVLQATRLESIVMQKGAERAGRTFDDPNAPPLWLLPLSNAGILHTQASKSTCLHLPYQGLHRLTLNLQHCNHPSLAHLFSLPALRRLHLRNLLDHRFLRWLRGGGGWEDINTYPDPSPWPAMRTAHSSVTSLVLENIRIPTSNIVWMILACKQLHCFSVTGDGNGDVVVSESRRWCVNILDALRVHKDVLWDLRLDPDLVYPLLADGGDEWACIQELKHFHRLKHLDTTFSSIFGHPHERLDGNGVFDFLLEKCETLRIRFDVILEANFDGVLVSSLSVDTSLTSLEVYYHYGNMFTNSTLTHPVDFWDVQQAFRRDGRVDFKYTIGFELWGSELDVEKFEDVSGRLADFGVRGVAIATRYEGYGNCNGRLEDRVMELLGLDKSWLSSEEGLRIMQ
jgi:hypothetical protein